MEKNMYKVTVISCTFNNLCILYFAFIFDFYFDKNIKVNISFVNVTFTLEFFKLYEIVTLTYSMFKISDLWSKQWVFYLEFVALHECKIKIPRLYTYSSQNTEFMLVL